MVESCVSLLSFRNAWTLVSLEFLLTTSVTALWWDPKRRTGWVLRALPPRSSSYPGAPITQGLPWAIWALTCAFSCFACRWQHALDFSALEADLEWTAGKSRKWIPSSWGLECQPSAIGEFRAWPQFSSYFVTGYFLLFFRIEIGVNHVCWILN